MRLRLESRAQREVEQIIDTYDDEQLGLGARFFDELTDLMMRIREMPLAFPTVSDNVHRALLERFPYSVYFRIVNGRKISIVAVFHQRRDPRAILRRLQIQS